MDENKNNEPVSEPDFSGEEMKMPEDQFGNTDEIATAQASQKPNMGPFIAILVVLLIIVLGGLYMWSTTFTPAPPEIAPVERPTPEENNEPESTTAEAQTETLEVVSTSDEVSAIEADLDSTDLDSLDAELEAIDAELEAALEEL